MRRTFRRVFTLSIAMVVGMLLGGATLAFGHGGDADLIHGCQMPGTGQLRLIGPNDECKNNETAVDWNVQGAAGPQGDVGATGAQGVQGETGEQGDTGLQGTQGIQGDPGPSGADGAVGEQGVQGGPGISPEEVIAITARLASLEAVIKIDTDGAVTIVSPGDLTLDPTAEVVIEGDTMLMDGATVMGETMLEGDTMLMQDATVMGETMLEGDTMLMQDAEFMGDATFEGGLVLPDTALTVVNGELTPATSSVTVIGFSGFDPLEHIAPAANSGTILEIHFGVSSDDIGGFGFVRPCSSCFGYRNIDLQQRSGEPFFFKNGDTLRLISRAGSWVEVSRSSGHVEAFSVTRATGTAGVGPGDTSALLATCTSAGGDGRAGAVLLSTSVNVLLGDVEIDSLTTETIRFGPEAGGEQVFLVYTNTESFATAHVELVLRCLSI